MGTKDPSSNAGELDEPMQALVQAIKELPIALETQVNFVRAAFRLARAQRVGVVAELTRRP